MQQTTLSKVSKAPPLTGQPGPRGCRAPGDVVGEESPLARLRDHSIYSQGSSALTLTESSSQMGKKFYSFVILISK